MSHIDKRSARSEEKLGDLILVEPVLREQEAIRALNRCKITCLSALRREEVNTRLVDTLGLSKRRLGKWHAEKVRVEHIIEHLVAVVVGFGDVNFEEHVPESMVEDPRGGDVVKDSRQLPFHTWRFPRAGAVKFDALACVVH